MSQELLGYVESVKLDGPFTVKVEGKNHGKTFHSHVLKINNVSVKQTDFRKEPKSPAEVGAKVKVLYTEGRFGNAITELKVLNGSEATSEVKAEPTVHSTTTHQTPTLATTSTTSKTYDNKGARIGMAVNKAVDIALALNILQAHATDLHPVEKLARDLIDIATKLEKE